MSVFTEHRRCPLGTTLFGLGLFFGLSALHGEKAYACGASASSGGVAVCSLSELREKERRKWHVGATYSYADTHIRFSGDGLEGKTTYRQHRHLALATLSLRPKRWWSLQFAAGALLAGQLSYRDGTSVQDRGRKTMRAGPAGAVATTFVLSQGKGWVPFGLVSGQLSVVRSSTGKGEGYVGSDLRLGGALGWRLGRVFLPYALGRVFGGPIAWRLDSRSVRGTDLYHYQLGLGLSLAFPIGLDIYIEGVPLGERGLSGGLGWAF